MVSFEEDHAYTINMAKWLVRKESRLKCPSCGGKEFAFSPLLRIPPVSPETLTRTYAPLTCPNCGFVMLFDYDQIWLALNAPDKEADSNASM